ncbi:MAG: AAA family ATPase [Candidatus Methanoperedens sp.]|nr:AAA family ATPase [Candidatus Methanoperedens sp.]
MSFSTTLSAEARGLTKAAKQAEEAGNIEQARALYLQAAGKFNEASALTSDKVEKNTQAGLAKHFYEYALSLGNQPSAIGGAPAGKEEKKLTKEDLIVHEKPNIRFSDIGGLDSVKEELKKAIIYPFTHKRLYEYYNQKPGGGVLLYGPPGCGKTMIAKAAACECGADFINVETSTIMSKWVGESEKAIKNIFEVARGCERAIIFFDEFDAVGGRRSEIEDYAKRIVNELLQQMDGMTKNDNILVLAATNEPWAIDPALRRPGRLKKLVFIPPPDLDARRSIFEIYLRKLPLEVDVDSKYLAQVTQGFSGADIAAVCGDASEIPLQEALAGKPQRKIRKLDFEKAMEGRRSSIVPWIRMAIEQVKKSREEDLFSELVKLGESYAAGSVKSQVQQPVKSEALQIKPEMISRIISGTRVGDGVLKSVLNIAVEISNEGREGKPVGTAFLIGDSKAVLAKSKQLVLNPFEGHAYEKRLVTNPEIWENIKEFAQLDGAFVISDDGLIECAGRYLTADADINLPEGFGTRHSSVAAITVVTNAIGIVVSQSGGIRIIKKGKIDAKI